MNHYNLVLGQYQYNLKLNLLLNQKVELSEELLRQSILLQQKQHLETDV